MKSIWILTEEFPKKEVIRNIIIKVCSEIGCTTFIDPVHVIPVLEEEKFCFIYEVTGFRSQAFEKVYLKLVSGSSSFVDYLVFLQENMPNITDTPLLLIEETKTDDSESRNTGVYQRCTKFVLASFRYPDVSKVMLYNLKVPQKTVPTKTNIFGTRMLKTLGVEIMGKDLDEEVFRPFSSIDELMQYKNCMRKAPKGNIPIEIGKTGDTISISGRLIKSDNLAHDPNIGALSVICASLRKLNWSGKIEIIKHGLEQRHINAGNKFVRVAQQLGVSLQGLTLPEEIKSEEYWHYEKNGEKIGTIFMHVAIENFTKGFSVFDNHAGCEKSYFMTAQGDYIPLQKYEDREAYKGGDKNKIIFIPDLVLNDPERLISIVVEGKKYEFRFKGIDELKGYDAFEKLYLKKFYPSYEIVRTVVLYGSHENSITEKKVGFLLNLDGEMILGIDSPVLFDEAVENVKRFWKP